MTSPGSQIGTVVLSIDVPAASFSGGRSNDKLARELFRMVESRQLAASWVPLDGGPFALSEQLAAHGDRHDLALAGESSWIGPTAGRTRFARELAARVQAAQAANLQVAAIALVDTQLDDHLDLLVKHRIGMIRGQRCGAANLQPRSIRFGVWYSPVSIVLPQPNDWSWLGSNRTLRQTIRRAIRAGGVAHIVIDATRFAPHSAALGEIDLVLAHLQRQRDKGVLEVMSLSRLTDKFVRKPTATKSKSILRAA